jgi:hypothetical protein
MTMSDLPDGPLMSGPLREQRRSAVLRSEKKLAALRLALIQAKRQLHEASAREQSIRKGTLGRAVWALIEQGRLEPSVIALIRDEVHPALSPGRAGAFIGTLFELPPPESAQEPEMVEIPVAIDEPELSAAKRVPVTRFRLPVRPAST